MRDREIKSQKDKVVISPKNITEVYNNDRKTIVVQNVFPILQT